MMELATKTITAESTIGSQRAESGVMRSLLVLTAARLGEATFVERMGQGVSREAPEILPSA
jgi:hypothetical protein